MDQNMLSKIRSAAEDFRYPIQKIETYHPPRLPIADSYADTQFEILQNYIQDFEKTIDDDHEVALLLTSFGHSITMQVTEVSYEEPVLMIFRGYVGGVMSTLIQHVSQLNFLLTSTVREQDRPKRKIGFVHPQTEEESSPSVQESPQSD